jgi:alpha-D-ribose 1-methylphosphonate 5-triphosphate synthase subunit PhnG
MANTETQISPEEAEMRGRRRETMALLAASSAAEIVRHLDAIGPLPRHEDVRSAESGMLMVRGRIGGDGAPFNFGEATVSRAVVRLESGEMGFGYVLGRDHAKARLIALCDALVQRGESRAALECRVLAPIRSRLAAMRKVDAERIAATKVEFFTLVRGED